MKTLHYLLFCADVLSPECVTYVVPVGISKREQAAHKKLITLTANDNRFFYAMASDEVSSFLSRVRDSWVSPNKFDKTYWTAHFRCIKTSPCRLVTFLRRFPAEFLNNKSAESLFANSLRD